MIDKIFAEHKKRIITGLSLIGVVAIIALIDNLFLTWLFFGVAFMGAFYESMKLFKVDEDYLYVIALVFWLIAYFYPNPDNLIFLVLIGVASVRAYNKTVDLKIIYPFLYPSVSFLFLLSLYKDFGMGIVIWLVLIVAITDTGAYFVGKSIGVSPFSETSPNKTMEGVVGGVLLATLISSFYGWLYLSFLMAFIISFVVSISSVFGDLFESYLKREANVKDSGNILPGHGGILDRTDGYLFGAVVLVVLLRGFA